MTDYSLYLSEEEQLSNLTVAQELGYVRFFGEYLNAHACGLEQVDDGTLLKFRNHSLLWAKRSKSSRGSLELSKATANTKLRRAYLWLQWLQDSGRIKHGRIGSRGCAVKSALSERRKLSERSEADSRMVSSIALFPLQYRLKTSNSKHQVPSFIPTELTLDDLHEYFFENSASDYIAHRNCLLIDVADSVGLRRASINSLRVSQFLDPLEVGELQTALIRPDSQKFSYANTFRFPPWIVERVRSFASEQRRQLIEDQRISSKVHGDRIFLSSRDGRPLTDRAITAIVSKALRKLGAPKGSAIHGFRYKFIDETVDAEYEDRLERGLDTSMDSITAAVSLKTGHKSVKSLRGYASASHAKRAAKVRSNGKEALLVYKKANETLKNENEALRAKVEQLSRQPVLATEDRPIT
jgi:site-specific recombinase XerD